MAAARLLLGRSKTLTRAITTNPPIRALHSFGSIIPSSDPKPAPNRPVNTGFSPSLSNILGSGKIWGHEKTLPRWFSAKTIGQPSLKQVDSATELKGMGKSGGKVEGQAASENEKKVISFSPLEAVSNKSRSTGLLSRESSKINRMELSQKITYALIPALLLVSKSSLTTSILIMSVYWQIYGFFKEIFLDYVHQEVTRNWVLIYFKVLLLILIKDTFLMFGLV